MPDHRRRSRRSRSRSPRRHHRNRSSSRDVNSSNIHINPNFNSNELEKCRLELFIAQSQVKVLEDDSILVREMYQKLVEEYTRRNDALVHVEAKLQLCQQRSANIEATNTALRTQVNTQLTTLTSLREKVKLMECAQTSHQDTIANLEKRNHVLVKRCEELTEKYRELQMERDEAVHEFYEAKQRLENSETGKIGDMELYKLRSEVEVLKQKEKQWIEKKATMDLEMKRLIAKHAAESLQHAKERQKDQKRIDSLTEELNMEYQYDVEDLYSKFMETLLAVQAIQNKQLDELKRRLEIVEGPPSIV